MFRSVRTAFLVSASALLPAAAPASWNPGASLHADSTGVYQPDQFLVVKQFGKADRRCVVLSATPKPDGLVEYRLKAVDNGDLLTITDKPGVVPPPPPVTIVPPTVLRAGATEPTAPATALAVPTKKADPGPPTRHGEADPLLTTVPPKIPAHLRPQVNVRPSEMPEEKPAVAMPVPKKTLPVPPVTTRPATPAPAPSASGSAPNRNIPVSLRPSIDPVPMTIAPPLPNPQATTRAIAEPVPVARMPRPPLPAATQSYAEPRPVGFVIPLEATKANDKSYGQERRVVEYGAVLRDSISPADREIAAMELTNGAGAASVEVRSMLLSAAAGDPAPTVRAACVRCLTKIGVKDRAYAALIAAAKQDPDARVRAEAEAAK
jgi:HEAT repeats